MTNLTDIFSMSDSDLEAVMAMAKHLPVSKRRAFLKSLANNAYQAPYLRALATVMEVNNGKPIQDSTVTSVQTPTYSQIANPQGTP